MDDPETPAAPPAGSAAGRCGCHEMMIATSFTIAFSFLIGRPWAWLAALGAAFGWIGVYLHITRTKGGNPRD